MLTIAWQVVHVQLKMKAISDEVSNKDSDIKTVGRTDDESKQTSYQSSLRVHVLGATPPSLSSPKN